MGPIGPARFDDGEAYAEDNREGGSAGEDLWGDAADGGSGSDAGADPPIPAASADPPLPPLPPAPVDPSSPPIPAASAAPSIPTPPAAQNIPAAPTDPATPAAPARRRPPRSGRRQAAAVTLLAVVLAAGLVVDDVIGTGGPPPAGANVPAMPSTAPKGAMSSSWYCPALGATAGSASKGRIVVANPTSATVTATVRVIPSAGPPIVENPVLQPYTRSTIRLEDVAPGDFAAATVTFDGTAGEAQQVVEGDLGQSTTPCASATSQHWYFATGETDVNTTEYLSLYNPYPAPAIADLSFETDQGPSTPQAFQAILVPGGGFNVIDVGARVRSRASVATEVNVRSGRLVVDELQVLANRLGSGPRGLALTLGAPALGAAWYYADPRAIGGGVTERFDVYNPTSQEADVTASPVLQQGSAEPFQLIVPPGGTVALETDRQARISPGVGQAWAFTSANGVPFVAERVIQSSVPGAGTGLSTAIGAPTAAGRWIFPAGSTGGGGDEWLVILDPGGTPAHVKIVVSGNGRAVEVPSADIPAGSRRAVHVARAAASGLDVLDLTSNVPVIAERAQVGTAGVGVLDSIGIAGS